ncbi:MAG TPA: penicillin-binding protein 2 [Candidatus Omnitrophota bacterium]|nr:penicillin-binding protein 2 [Candidatus Omnitrophota bacterium]
MRIKILRVLIIIVFIITLVNLVYLQAIRGSYYYKLSKNNRIRLIPMEGWRGRIFDRQKVLLADNQLSYNAMITPQDIKNTKELFLFLSSVLGVDRYILEENYEQKTSFSFAPVVIAENITREQAIILEENKYRFPSLVVSESFRRVYPLGQNSAHVLGYVGKVSQSQIEKNQEYGYSPLSFVGYLGVEEYYDNYLRGGSGGLQVEVNSRGQQVRLLSVKEPLKGQDITLTIDSRIQQKALQLLDEHVGSIIVMDADNGEMLAMTNAPAFDPNMFNQRKSFLSVQRLFSHPLAPLLNRSIKGLYPPGSVFKIPIAFGGLDSGKIAIQTTFHCPGFYEIGGIKFKCAHQHGAQNLYQALTHSCNVYFYRLGLLLGADSIYRYAKIFGLGELTHVDLPYEKSGHIPYRQQNILSGKKWYTGNTLNISIGQGDVLITPLQLTRMMATIFNDGLEVQPHVISAIGNHQVAAFSTRQQSWFASPVSRFIKESLRNVVKSPEGTAHILDIPGLNVSGKTGTAQASGTKKDHAWFVGYVKGESRNIAFCVFLENGGSSENACYVARDLLNYLREKEIL